MRKRSWLVVVGLCVHSSLARAQDQAPPAKGAEPPNQSLSTRAQAPPPARESQAVYPPQAPPATNGLGAHSDGTEPDSSGPREVRATPEDPYHLRLYRKYPLKLDLLATLPVAVSDEHDSSKVGFGISGLFGWNLGFLLPTVGFGWSWSKLNLPPGYRDDDRNLKRIHISLGLMAEFENKSIVTPVFGALLDFNFWNVGGNDSLVCGGYYWGCYQVDNYLYTTGFTFRAGIDVRFFRNDRFGLGAGVLPHVTLKGAPFTEAEWWISPYVLFTLRTGGAGPMNDVLNTLASRRGSEGRANVRLTSTANQRGRRDTEPKSAPAQLRGAPDAAALARGPRND